jgi:hypothetical protein
MEVLDGLAAVTALVGDHPVALRPNFLSDLAADLQDALRGVRAGRRHEPAEVGGVLGWNHQDVVGRLGIEIAKRDDVVVPEKLPGGDLTPDDLAE